MSKIGRSGKSGRSTICCQQFGLECQRFEEVEEVEEVRFVASNLGLSVKDWIGSERNGRSTICCQQFGHECQRLDESEILLWS